MSWFQVRDGRLRYRGGVTREPFDDWMASREGAAAVATAARAMRFAWLGRTRAAKRRIGRELRDGMTAAAVKSALAAEPDRHLAAWAALAYAPSLPRLHVALHRLVVVPRTMILARALPGVTGRLNALPEFAALDGSFGTFMSHRVLCEMEDAIAAAKPSSRRPLAIRDGWVCVALDRTFMWIDALLSGEEWLGHMMLFEMPARGLQRRERRELDAAIERLSAELPSLSRHQRSGLIRTATAELRVA